MLHRLWPIVLDTHYRRFLINVYYSITIVIFILTCVMTQFMSNVVTITPAGMPIIIAIAQTIEYSVCSADGALCCFNYVDFITDCVSPGQSDLCIWRASSRIT